jgi:FlaA1/EpsC-like NDP-sugar epimerase
VAFSAGSLLASWHDRLAKRQPLAVPRDTRRYFVSGTEAAEICLLAGLALPGAHLAVPRMTVEADLRELAPIADAFVRDAGFTPAWYDTEDEARRALEGDVAAGRWPILRTARDTDGEKAEEEFVGRGESSIDVGWAELRGIPQYGVDPAALQMALDQLEAWVAQPELRADRADVGAVIASVVPEFAHAASGKSLDDRM